MTTMAGSASMPTATISPKRLITFSVVSTRPDCRPRYMITKVVMMESGIATATSSVVRTFCRKSSRMSMASPPPNIPAMASWDSPPRTSSEESRM